MRHQHKNGSGEIRTFAFPLATMMMRSAAVRVSPRRERVIHVCNVDGCVLVASFGKWNSFSLMTSMSPKILIRIFPHMCICIVYVSLPLEQVAKSTARVHFRRRSVAGSATVCQQRCLFVVPNCSARRNDILAMGNQPDAQDPHSSIISRYQSSASAALVDDDDTDHDNTKVVPFLLADIGEGIAEVELLQWFVEPGMRVQQFDRVCEVQSDKATVEITSRFDGVIDSLNGQVGDMISVGSPLLHIAVEDSASTPSPDPPASAPTPSQRSTILMTSKIDSIYLRLHRLSQITTILMIPVLTKQNSVRPPRYLRRRLFANWEWIMISTLVRLLGPGQKVGF